MATRSLHLKPAPAAPKPPQLNLEVEKIVRAAHKDAQSVTRQIEALQTFNFTTAQDDGEIHHFSDAMWTLLELIVERSTKGHKQLGAVLGEAK
jgi:hypothetical protein